jgi:hypothetical protein
MKASSSSKFATKGDLGFIPLDEALELYNFESLITYDSYNVLERKDENNFCDEIDDIASKYLNNKEQCIYKLIVHEKKKTVEIVEIFKYNNWRTAQNSIDRVFKLLALYYHLEQIDKDDLNYELERNFTNFEKKVIKFLEERLTIQEINEKIKKKKYHYAKTHSLIKNILERLENSGGSCKQYFNFLIEVRKFKDLCVWSDKENIIDE